MAAVRFNAITYANKLKKAKDDNDRADIQAEELSNILNNELATKQDILLVKQDIFSLKQDIEKIKLELQAFIVKGFITSIVAMSGLLSLLHFIKV